MRALTKAQSRRLGEMIAATSGRSYLADQGHGMHAARAWWNTMTTLEGRGLVCRLCDPRGDLVEGYEITPAGREAAK